MTRKKDLYRILGVNQNADSTKIKQAYRRAAKKYHPDVLPKSEEKFKEVQQAYETLSDPEKKAHYDIEVSKKSIPRPSSGKYAHTLPPFLSLRKKSEYCIRFRDDDKISK